MNNWLWSAFGLLLAGQTAVASTFVGNGGGAGDIELAVSTKQVKEAMTAIQRRAGDKDISLCQCNGPYENRSVCEPLRNLNTEQKQFCTQALFRQAGAVYSILNDQSTVSIRWTHEPISVRDRGLTRAVDAVTDRTKREITINLPRFLQMLPFERVYLLTHEVLHLTYMDGKALEDEGAIGPFDGDQGGRRLLDAMGSAAAVLPGAYPSEFKNFAKSLDRVQSWKPWWLEINFGKAEFGSQPAGTFAISGYARTQLKVRRTFGQWSFMLGHRYHTQTKRALGTVEVKETSDIFSAGAGYRLFFFKDPTTYWGQSHLLLEGLVDFTQNEITVADPLTSLKERQDSFGGSAQATYYIPGFWGLWFNAGVGIESHPYKYKQVNVKYDKKMLSHFFGVSYAF